MADSDGDQSERPPFDVVTRIEPVDLIEPEDDAGRKDDESRREPRPRVVARLRSHAAPCPRDRRTESTSARRTIPVPSTMRSRGQDDPYVRLKSRRCAT